MMRPSPTVHEQHLNLYFEYRLRTGRRLLAPGMPIPTQVCAAAPTPQTTTLMSAILYEIGSSTALQPLFSHLVGVQGCPWDFPC
eukprot:scaffold177559_cov31-Tisochrysis_lutea.AAC.6